MGDLKIKIEHLRPEGTPKDQTNFSTNCRIYDEDTGRAISAVQKLTIIYSATDFMPRATLEVVNFESVLEGIDATVEITQAGPECKRIDEMSITELVAALKWEAKQRWLTTRKAIDLSEELKDK
ncbi:hypothetical protein LCGC14_0426950 [marine sediment metagenome]|uniref:Uncharacterized protein n=1 Tax=marine sediment metagenome TaxID=412755 RepID=A0A0F9VYL8_9ZZZZ